MTSRLPCVTPEVRELALSLFSSEVACLVCVECLKMIKLMVVVFFYWRLMLIWVMSVGFENTCSVYGK